MSRTNIELKGLALPCCGNPLRAWEDYWQKMTRVNPPNPSKPSMLTVDLRGQVTKASSGPVASGLVPLGERLLFLGSWTADSLLLKTNRQHPKARPRCSCQHPLPAPSGSCLPFRSS